MKNKKHLLYNFIFCLFLLFVPALHVQASAVINSVYPVEVTEDAVVIDGGFQVDVDFDLNYLPFFHRMKDGELAYGYFVLQPDEGQSFAEADKVSLARYTLSGKNLLEDKNARLREIQMQRVDSEEEEFSTQVFYLIDGNAGIDLVIRLESVSEAS